MTTEDGLHIQIPGTTADGRVAMDVHFDDGSIGEILLTNEEVLRLQKGLSEARAGAKRHGN